MPKFIEIILPKVGKICLDEDHEAKGTAQIELEKEFPEFLSKELKRDKPCNLANIASIPPQLAQYLKEVTRYLIIGMCP